MIRISGPGAAAGDYALVTRAELKAFLKNAPAASDDALLDTILENIHRRFAEELGGRILKDTDTAFDYVLNGDYEDRIYLPHFPVVTVSSLLNVRMAGGGTFTTLQTFAATDYQIEAASGTLLAVTRSFPQGANTIRCTWKAGYATVPASARDAICQWAATAYRRINESRHDVTTLAHETDATTYTRLDRPDSVQAVIDRFKYLEATIA